MPDRPSGGTGRLAGKVAIITGGARGMGASHAEIFVEQGARVVIADVLEAEGQALADRLGDAAVFARLDVTSRRDWDVTLALAEKTFGPVNVLIANAGVATESEIEHFDDEDYARVIAVNQTSIALGTRAVIPSMRRAGGGSIVNIASTASITGHARGSIYSASKGAVTAFSRAAAIELAPLNIRVNSIHPGLVRTPMIGVVDVTKEVTPLIPLKRIGEPWEISMMAVFLASDESGFSTGAQFVADGGYTAQ